jgi:hypothetical protein
MQARRLRLDLFAFSLGALTLLTLGFFSARNGAAVVMCGLCFAGLLAARLAGFSNRALVPLTAGLVILLWVLWIHPPPLTSVQTSALAHGTGGLLVGWAIADYLRARLAWPLWAIGAVAVVFGLTVLWEVGELFGDRALDTALVPSKRDSAIDISFGTLGGAAGVLVATLLPSRAAR